MTEREFFDNLRQAWRYPPLPDLDPRTVEAVSIVRSRHKDGLGDLPDEAVANLMQTKHVEFALARRELYRSIRNALPERLRRRLGG